MILTFAFLKNKRSTPQAEASFTAHTAWGSTEDHGGARRQGFTGRTLAPQVEETVVSTSLLGLGKLLSSPSAAYSVIILLLDGDGGLLEPTFLIQRSHRQRGRDVA